MLFLIQYDRPSGTIIQLREFDDSSRKLAEDARLELELALKRQDIRDEVVLLEAPSQEALLRTHSRYFEGLAELVKAKLGIGASDQ